LKKIDKMIYKKYSFDSGHDQRMLYMIIADSGKTYRLFYDFINFQYEILFNVYTFVKADE